MDLLIDEQDPNDTTLVPVWVSEWTVTQSGLEKSGKFAELRGIVSKDNATPDEVIGQLPDGVFPIREEIYQSLDGDNFATFRIDTLGRIHFVNGVLPMPINKIFRIEA
ncbi:hypothetical protein [Coleofasciculus sp. F4-SAH-05]|uniref:hypothetical protein n=1 Tax=Coleofasciculus sp. F4-SAH-05 TaxID=3069525 RepID=UPI0032F18426